jgi:hypothetical protein
MKMKLNDKAVDAFVESGEGFTHPSKWNFEPDDFDGVVVLTLAEAKALRDYTKEFYNNQCHVSDEFEELFDEFRERIIQAESSTK